MTRSADDSTLDRRQRNVVGVDGGLLAGAAVVARCSKRRRGGKGRDRPRWARLCRRRHLDHRRSSDEQARPMSSLRRCRATRLSCQPAGRSRRNRWWVAPRTAGQPLTRSRYSSEKKPSAATFESQTEKFVARWCASSNVKSLKRRPGMPSNVPWAFSATAITRARSKSPPCSNVTLTPDHLVPPHVERASGIDRRSSHALGRA